MVDYDDRMVSTLETAPDGSLVYKVNYHPEAPLPGFAERWGRSGGATVAGLENMRWLQKRAASLAEAELSGTYLVPVYSDDGQPAHLSPDRTVQLKQMAPMEPYIFTTGCGGLRLAWRGVNWLAQDLERRLKEIT